MKNMFSIHTYHPSGIFWTSRCWFPLALPFTLKSMLRPKEELWKLKYFTMQKIPNLQKNPLKETQILQDIIITLLL
jgi:hypothetical protein